MTTTKRLASLDLFRGLIMFLLVAEGARVYTSFSELTDGTFLHYLAEQFHHHPWNGLRFWDLIQPYFMFIVGVAMWFSVQNREKKGQTRAEITRHIIVRSLLLLMFGVLLHIGYRRALVWELWNVLSQLSITIPIAYFLMRLPNKTQLAISIGLLVLTEVLYRFTGIEGYDQPFIIDQNFGSFMDMVLMGKLNNGGGWVAINCIPTAAHTIWGVLAGKLLASEQLDREKIQTLLLYGGIGLVVGYGLDWTGLTPIIKRICTSSFVIVSGGWCLLTLAFFYGLLDVRGRENPKPAMKRWPWFFIIVGMNPIFIYLFMNTVGGQWLVGFVEIFSGGIGTWLGLPDLAAAWLNSLLVLGIAWYLCYWLYKREIFIKI
jgi:predicted acyltransferase